MLQVNHAELGGLIGAGGNADNIILGIIHHHAPAKAPCGCDAVYLANLAAKKIEASLSKKQIEFKLDTGVALSVGGWRQFKAVRQELPIVPEGGRALRCQMRRSKWRPEPSRIMRMGEPSGAKEYFSALVNSPFRSIGPDNA